MLPVHLHIEMCTLDIGKQLMGRSILHQKVSPSNLTNEMSSLRWHKGCIQNIQKYIFVNPVFWMKIDQGTRSTLVRSAKHLRRPSAEGVQRGHTTVIQKCPR